MQTYKIQAPFDRYSVAFPDLGIGYLAEVEWKRHRPHRVHDHQEMQVLWIMAGVMGLEIEDRRITPPAGACYVIPAGRMHNVFQLADNPDVAFLDLRLLPPSSMLPYLEKLAPRVYFRTSVRKLKQHAKKLRSALRLPDLLAAARAQAALWDLIADTLTNIPDDTPREEHIDPRLELADRFLQDQAGRPIGVDDVAEHVGLSRSQLTRLYRQHLGVGPAERLRVYRVQRANSLLRGSTFSVKQIARMCGFACPNHFCRVFLQVMKLTPTQYRLQQGGSNKRS